MRKHSAYNLLVRRNIFSVASQPQSTNAKRDSFLQRLNSVCEAIPVSLGADIDTAPLSDEGIPDISSNKLREFRACQELLSSCRLSDLIDPQALSGSLAGGRWLLESLLRENVCLGLLESRWAGKMDFDVAAFVIPAGGVMPIHGHAGMVVSSKVLHGQLDLTSFHSIGSDNNSSDGGDDGGLFPVEMTTQRISAKDPAWFLSPAFRNIHRFAAAGDQACIVLDVLLPPYDHIVRRCDFYEVTSPTTNINDHTSTVTGGYRTSLRPIAAPNHLLPYAVSYP